MRDALPRIAKRKAELEALDPNAINREEDEAQFDTWPPMWNETLSDIFPPDSISYQKFEIQSLQDYESFSMVPDFMGGRPGYDVRAARDAYARGKRKALQAISTIERSFTERIEHDRPVAKAAPIEKEIRDQSPSDVELLERLLRRFHSAARTLKSRHAKRPPFVIDDEYDVQDLMQALLRSLFDDVRPEEYAPSYAGGASRMDFLLKAEQIVIEAKMANDKLRDKDIGEQLMVDIQRYSSHPDCKRLICFVYDPNGFVKNPRGLEADLTKKHNGLDVRVIVLS
jgi:hypothetical protein